jgi:hypothetical protein
LRSIAAEILVPLQLEAYVRVGIGAEQLSLPSIQLMRLLGLGLGLGSIRFRTFYPCFVRRAGKELAWPSRPPHQEPLACAERHGTAEPRVP